MLYIRVIEQKKDRIFLPIMFKDILQIWLLTRIY
jgi:hypothetical protein